MFSMKLFLEKMILVKIFLGTWFIRKKCNSESDDSSNYSCSGAGDNTGCSGKGSIDNSDGFDNEQERVCTGRSVNMGREREAQTRKKKIYIYIYIYIYKKK